MQEKNLHHNWTHIYQVDHKLANRMDLFFDYEEDKAFSDPIRVGPSLVNDSATGYRKIIQNQRFKPFAIIRALISYSLLFAVQDDLFHIRFLRH